MHGLSTIRRMNDDHVTRQRQIDTMRTNGQLPPVSRIGTITQPIGIVGENIGEHPPVPFDPAPPIKADTPRTGPYDGFTSGERLARFKHVFELYDRLIGPMPEETRFATLLVDMRHAMKAAGLPASRIIKASRRVFRLETT